MDEGIMFLAQETVVGIDGWLDVINRWGVSGVLLFMLWRWLPQAASYFGHNILEPIRDAMISNITLQNELMKNMQKEIPALSLNTSKIAEDVKDTSEAMNDKQDRIADDVGKSGRMIKIVALALAHKCPVTECPIRRKDMDSDDFSEGAQETKQHGHE